MRIFLKFGTLWKLFPLKSDCFSALKDYPGCCRGGISCFYQVSQNNQMNYKVMYIIQKEL